MATPRRTEVGQREVGEIRHSDVQGWVTGLSKTLGATSVLRSYGVLAGILDIAVKDRRLASNPARGVNLPRKTGKRHTYLSNEQVQLLATEAGDNAVMVLTLAYTGLRWGEATGLRVRYVDLVKRRLNVSENAVMVGGSVHVGTPKTHVTRSVPFPAFLQPMLEEICGRARPANWCSVMDMIT